jgi:hypothetical protein
MVAMLHEQCGRWLAMLLLAATEGLRRKKCTAMDSHSLLLAWAIHPLNSALASQQHSIKQTQHGGACITSVVPAAAQLLSEFLNSRIISVPAACWQFR